MVQTPLSAFWHTSHVSCVSGKKEPKLHEMLLETHGRPGLLKQRLCGVTGWGEEGHPSGRYVVMLYGVHLSGPWRQMTSMIVSPSPGPHEMV